MVPVAAVQQHSALLQFYSFPKRTQVSVTSYYVFVLYLFGWMLLTICTDSSNTH